MERTDTIRILLSEQAPLLAYISMFVADDALTDEIFQEVAVLLLDAHDKLQNEDHVRGWLRITAKNLALKALRDRSKQPLALDDQTLEAIDPHWQRVDHDALGDRLESLRICMSRLSDYAQRIIHLRYRSGLVGDDLALALNRSKQTVYTALTRIHKALAECVRHREQALYEKHLIQE